ncbi:hypothetical protein [Thiohalocapsa marina]|uniref:hypothetical protein n=1 Tax=Thiohalocapsa marina TaxID=424902 RepID=UPI001479073F|nr:hypothetical protein [Thiohalocapsa marina]
MKLDYSGDEIIDSTQPQELISEIESQVGGEVIGYSIKGGQDMTHYLYEDNAWEQVSSEELEDVVKVDPDVFNDNDIEGTWDGEEIKLDTNDDEGGKKPKFSAMMEPESGLEPDDSTPPSDSDEASSEQEDTAPQEDEPRMSQETSLEDAQAQESAYPSEDSDLDQPEEPEEPVAQDREPATDAGQDAPEPEDDDPDAQEGEPDEFDLFPEEELVVFEFEEAMQWTDMLEDDGLMPADQTVDDWTGGAEEDGGTSPDEFDTDFGDTSDQGDEDSNDPIDW